MNYRIVQLEHNVNGIEDNDRVAVYYGAEIVFEYTGQDAVSICCEWRADAQS